MEKVIKDILECYINVAEGERIVCDDGPQKKLIFSVWSDLADQDQVEEMKLKIDPEKISEDHKEILELNEVIWDETLRAWIY